MNQPIKNYKHALYPEGSVTQWFGANPSLYRLWGLAGHNGIDIVAPHGEPLFAVENGTVVSVKYDPSGFGKHIRILSDASDNGKYREWTYGHLSSIHVTVGEKVKAGEIVGKMGNTGFVVSGSTPYWPVNPYAGTHLHLGLRYAIRDSGGWSYPGSDIKIQIMDYENGYKGAVDPAPFFTETQPTTKRQQYLTILSLQNTLISLLKQLIGQRK